MTRAPPEISQEEVMKWMFHQRETLEGLEPLRRQMPEGSTLEDALRLHRKMAQHDRQPSKVMDES